MNEDVDLLNDSIEELTTTGKEELNIDELSKLKVLCKKSERNVRLAYELLDAQLRKNHAEIRYSAFQIMNELFVRSHVFREVVVANLHTIFMLTLGTDKNYVMPPPLYVSKKLKKFALLEYNKWFSRYGIGYLKLQLGFEFLRDVKKIKFNDLQVQTLAEQERAAKQKEKEEALNRSKLQQVDMQFHDQSDSIKSNIEQMQRCFQLIVPKCGNEEEYEKETGGDLTETVNEVAQFEVGNEAGLVSSKFAISVEINPQQKIQETLDNTDILKRLQELHKEVFKQVITVKRWLNVLVKCKSQNSQQIKHVLQLKNTLMAMCNQYKELNIYHAQSDEDDDDEEFIDVPEKMDVVVSESKKELRYDSPGPSNTSSPAIQSTSSSSNDSPTSRRQHHLKVAPVVSFDTDLKRWGSADRMAVPSSVKYDSLHRFWRTAEHEESFIPPQVEASMRERSMVYETEFQPVTRMCGALLPSGAPCQRMDRYKCPFHGDIVERDMYGTPVNQRDAEKELKRKREKEVEEKKNIQKDIDAALGTTLSRHKNKKRKQLTAKEKSKERYKRLTKINNELDCTNARLSKKVFSVRSLDKMSSSANTHARRKHDEKFGSNFNY